MNCSYIFTNVAIVEIEEAYGFQHVFTHEKRQSYGIFVPVSGETFLDIEEIQPHMPVV